MQTVSMTFNFWFKEVKESVMMFLYIKEVKHSIMRLHKQSNKRGFWITKVRKSRLGWTNKSARVFYEKS